MSETNFTLLSEGQKECLRLFHERWEIKDIARHIGRSTVTVNQRLAAARKHLGVSRSSEAARLLAEHEGRAAGVYSPPIYVPEILGPSPLPSPNEWHGNDRQPGFPLPFPTRGRPINDFSFAGKLTYALILAALIILTFGGAVAALSGLSELF